MLHFLWLSICGLVACYCAYSVWHFSRMEDLAVQMKAAGDHDGAEAASLLASHAKFWRVAHILVGIAAAVQIVG